MNKSIFKWFSMLLLMMVAGMTGATAQSLIIDDFSIKSGETKDVPINLTVGENTVYGIQTDIVLSEGLTLEEVVAGEIAGENLSIASNVVGSGATRISQLSYTGETITAGNVITLKVTAAEDFTGGTIQLTNTRLTINTTGSEVTVNDLIVTVTKDEPLVINSMQLYGTFPGLSWEVGVEMTNTDSEPAIWSKTFEGVVLEGTTYEYKVSANGTWGEYQIPADNTNQTWTFGTDMYPAGTYNLTFTVDTENHTLSLTADKQAEPVKNELITLPCKENYTEGKFLLIEATEEISCNVWLEKVDAQTGARRFFKVAAGSTIMEDGVAMIELPEGYTEGEFTICADKEFTLKSVQLMATEDAAQPEEVIYTIEPEPEATYTVVGGFTDEGGIDNLLFGKQWDPSLTDNDLVKGTDGIYTWTKENVALEAGTTILYKVVKNHSWDKTWGFGDNNADYVINETATYNVTFKFNPTEVLINGFNVDCEPVKQTEPHDPFDYEKIAIDPADHSTVESLQNFTLTFDGQLVTVNSEVKPTLGDALGEIALNGDGSVSVTFASAQTNPGDYTLEIPAGAILYYGTAIDPLSFKYTIAGGADFTIDPAEGVVESLSTFTVNFSYYIEAPEATAYLFNEETEQEITANVYEGAGKSLTVMLSEEVTTPGDWQLNIEGVKKMDGTPVELIFSYTIKDGQPDQNYYILGDFWGWDNPKQMEATETEGIYTLVIDATVDAQKYEYKLRQGDNWNGYQLPADNSNYDFVFGTDEYPAGDYTLTFTFNRAEDKLVLDVQKKSDKPELDSYTYSFCQATNGWTTIDADGDGFTWYIYIDNNNPGYDSKPGLMTSASYANNKALTPDNYLVSPKMKLDGKISFYASAQDASYPSEHFGVAVSTASGTDAADFQMITEEMEMTSARELANAPAKGPRRVQGKWYFYEVDLSSFAGAEGYVAIRHYDCTDMFRLNVDGITLETSQLIDPYDPELEIEPGPEPEPEVVVVPEGLVVEEYSSAYTDYEGEEKTGSMNVGFDGTDVYIQGMCSYLSNAWVKGSLEGNTITFAGKQFFGTFANKYDMFLQNSDVVFIYDAEAGTLTSEDVIYTYSGNLYADYYVNLILTKVNEMAVTPATPSISGIQETSYGDIVVFEVPTVDVDGNGLATSKLSYQFFVDNEDTPLEFTTEYFSELTENMTVIPYGFTENYDFYPTYIYLNMPHDTWKRLGIQSIYTGGGEENKSEIFWFEMPADPVEAPDGLTTETYIFKANALEYSSSGGIEHPDYTLQVQVGFDGDDAYIQGLAADMQELWVKATKNEQGQYVIPANQYMGDLSFYGYTFPYYWTALDAENNLVDAVLDFDAETSTFTTEQTLALNGDANALDYYLLFNDVIITKFEEVAATPANPTFENFILSEEVGYTKIYASIPTVGTEGEALNTSKLFYIVWIEKDGVEQPYTFTADLYDQDFEEDVTEVPYSHDGYDIYKGGEIIYLEDAIEELATWTKVGIQSVYYGCDERNVSNIVWSDGTTTGIENLNSVKGDLSGAWYNLNGVRIAKPTQKGLYIVNGKKVMVK